MWKSQQKKLHTHRITRIELKYEIEEFRGAQNEIFCSKLSE